MKRAQIKMGETIAVLIVFFILLMFGLIYYTKFKGDSITKSMEEVEMLDLVDVTTRISLLPELQCTSLSIECGNSIDLLKLEAFAGAKGSQMLPGNPYYDMFHSSLIKFNEVYPNNHNWTVYNYTMNKTSYKVVYVPMTLHNATSGEFYFGYLAVNVYA